MPTTSLAGGAGWVALNLTASRLAPLGSAALDELLGIERDEPNTGTLFEDATLMYEAAAAGQGVALGLKTLFEAELGQDQGWWNGFFVSLLAKNPEGKP